MTFGLVLFTLVFAGLTVGAYWSLYQVTLAAWRSPKAKPHWLAFLASPIGQFISPVCKWLLPTAAVVFVIVLLLRVFWGSHAI